MKAPTIKTSSNYDEFGTILGNRIINTKKVEKIVNDITSGLNMLPYCPILVYSNNGLLKIVDGQHRFKAAVASKNLIYYVECNELDLSKIARMNSRSDKWKNSDFLECYMQLGLKDYVILSEFIDEYKIVYSVAVSMLMNKRVQEGGSSNSMDDFRNGEFKVNYLEWSKALADKSLEVFGRYKFWNHRGLLCSVNELMKSENCDFEVLKAKIKSAPNLMEKKSNLKEYLYLIEKVYNYNNTKRVTLF